MVDCTRFLEGYSAFRDGELEDDVRVDFEVHLELCPSCARYDQVLNEGVRLYRRCAELTPSEDFLPRLQHRLYHVDDEVRAAGRTGSGARMALTVAVAASIAGLAWVPALRPTSTTVVQLPAVAARAPLPPPPAPALMEGSGSIFTPVGLPFGAWNAWEAESLAADLLFRYPSPARSYTVQPVLNR